MTVATTSTKKTSPRVQQASIGLAPTYRAGVEASLVVTILGGASTPCVGAPFDDGDKGLPLPTGMYFQPQSNHLFAIEGAIVTWVTIMDPAFVIQLFQGVVM